MNITGLANIWFINFTNKLLKIPFFSKVEAVIFEVTKSNLPLSHKEIFESQLNLINYKKENTFSKEIYFYYFKSGVPSNDFPLLFKVSSKNKRLAEFEILINDTNKFNGFLNVISGRFFSLQFKEGLPKEKITKVELISIKTHNIELI